MWQPLVTLLNAMWKASRCSHEVCRRICIKYICYANPTLLYLYARLSGWGALRALGSSVLLHEWHYIKRYCIYCWINNRFCFHSSITTSTHFIYMSVVQNVQWTRHIITVHLCQRKGQKHPRCYISGTAITHAGNLWRICYNPFCVSNTAATYLFLSSWKKCTYFQCPLSCTQPKKWRADRAGTKRLAAQPLASDSKSSREKKNHWLWHHPWLWMGCRMLSDRGKRMPPTWGSLLSMDKLGFPGRYEHRALQSLDLMRDDPERTCSGKQSPSTYGAKHPGTNPAERALRAVQLPRSRRLAHVVLTTPRALG